MPDMHQPTKNWSKVDKTSLAKLVHNKDADIKDLSTNNIGAVRREYFCHRNKKNFRCNFQNFTATFNLKAEYSRAKEERK